MTNKHDDATGYAETERYLPLSRAEEISTTILDRVVDSEYSDEEAIAGLSLAIYLLIEGVNQPGTALEEALDICENGIIPEED
jgi:hypothetical protein